MTIRPIPMKLLYLTIALAALVALSILPKDAPHEDRSMRAKLSDNDYALNQLSIPYIEDPYIQAAAARIYWCGTPTIQYLGTHPEPDPLFLRANAVKLAATIRFSGGKARSGWWESK